MCLILFSVEQHARYPLIIAANRDEHYDRPSAPLGFWTDAPQIAGGRDLEAGGTWLGITRQGRWAALTNYRQAGSYRLGAPSRGHLVSNYLLNSHSPQRYIESIADGAQQLAIAHKHQGLKAERRDGRIAAEEADDAKAPQGEVGKCPLSISARREEPDGKRAADIDHQLRRGRPKRLAGSDRGWRPHLRRYLCLGREQ